MDGPAWELLLKGYAWWALLPAAAAASAGIIRLYRRETETKDRAGFWLRVLRGSAVALIVGLLAQPVIHRAQTSNEPPLVLVLEDRSASMSVKDAQDSPARQVQVAAAMGLLTSSQRLNSGELAAGILTRAQAQVDSAQASLRSATQLLDEAGSGATSLIETLQHASTALLIAAPEIEQAEAALKSVTGERAGSAKGLAASLKRLQENARRLAQELSAFPTQDRNAKKSLAERTQSLKVLAQELLRTGRSAQQLQDELDATLVKNAPQNVKAVLARVRDLDRSGLIRLMFETRAREAAGERVRLVHYAFDTELRSSDSNVAQESRNDTDLATPLLRAAELHAQDNVTAMLLCSDGRHTRGLSPEDSARALNGRGIAVYTLGVGSAGAPRDVSVALLEAPPTVFRDETIRLVAHVKTFGFKGTKAALVFKRGATLLQRRELTLGENGWMQETLELPAADIGANTFTAMLEPIAGEAWAGNNTADAIVDVAGDRLRVLLVDELPRWETRYIASLLRRERNVQLTERWLQTRDDAPARGALPEGEKALLEYDAIVLGDVGPERLSDDDQRRLSQYVSARGGFLILCAGPRALPRAYASGPLAELLPIRQRADDGSTAPLATSDAPARVRVKAETSGSYGEILRVFRDPALNAELWGSVPDLQWVARPAFAKPGATTLLTTDDARHDAVVAVHNFGAGRVLYCGTEETWRWRLKTADRVHAVFWSQALRWGTSVRLAGGSRLKVAVDRRQVRPGDTVEILARPLDENGMALTGATVSAEVEEEGSSRRRRVELRPVEGSPGLFRGVLSNVERGVSSLRISAESGTQRAEESLQVIARDAAGQEGIELSRDTARLSAIAAAGGGRAADLFDAPLLLADISGVARPRTTIDTYEVWASYPALLLVAGLLILEWSLRKRLGLA